jgi:ATP-dependent Clp protease ATP-binding subunit ClpA
MRQRINLTISEAAIQWFANAGFDPAFGARPLKRVMQRKITNRVSALILSGEIEEGEEVAIDIAEGELTIMKTVV